MADTISVLNMAQIQFALNPPTFFGYQNTVQSIPNTTWTGLSIDVGVDDNYTGHSNVTNNSRYVCQVAGTYAVSGCYAPVGNSTGFRASRIQKNGSPYLGASVYVPNNGASEVGVLTPIAVVPMVIGDYVEVAGWQSSGAGLNTAINVDLRCSLTVRFLHF